MKTDLNALIKKRFTETGSLISKYSQDEAALAKIAEISAVVIEAFKKNKKVLLFGNGGSAADAQHFAGELVGGYTNHNRRPLDVHALTTNTTNITAIGNDYSYEEVFSRQVSAHAQPGDVVIGISTSGNSKNVLAGIEAAKKAGAVTIGFTSLKGGKLKGIVDYALCSNSDSTPRTQELHITAIHAICELVELELFGPSPEH